MASYGSVQMGLMEKGLTWFRSSSPSPMLGFMGTVVGMIQAFDAIQAAGDVSATLVAGGIKVAASDDARRSYRGYHPAVVL